LRGKYTRMNIEDFKTLIKKLIEKYSKVRDENFLVREEYIDHGILQNRTPEYLLEINDYSKLFSDLDVLDEDLEVVKVCNNIKLFTKTSNTNKGKLFVKMSGEELIFRLKELRNHIICGYIKPPGILYRDKDHFKIKIDGIKFHYLKNN
jgi:hypothetical protein